jgi:hypothetical protein
MGDDDKRDADDKGFKVEDRRASASTTADRDEDEPHGHDDDELFELPGHDEYPPIDFNTFVLSLSTSALVNLGVVAHPGSPNAEVNLPLAKQSIDLLAVLEEKTRGNLTGEEERLLAQILYDLRLRYVAAAKQSGPPGAQGRT